MNNGKHPLCGMKERSLWAGVTVTEWQGICLHHLSDGRYRGRSSAIFSFKKVTSPESMSCGNGCRCQSRAP